MICPVCEHPQDFGLECDVCGKSLGGLDELGPPPVMLEQLDGLEGTLAEPVALQRVERLGELEVTHHAPVQVMTEVTPELEHTSAPPVGQVQVEQVDLSVDRAPDDGTRTQLPVGPVPCRACSHVQASGRFCDRCGNRLPVFVSADEAITGTLIVEEGVKVRCRACGAPAMAGQRCGDCGRDVPFPDA